MTNQNTVLIIGSGRSGRGMLGELYHKAGFHIVFADNDPITCKRTACGRAL